MGMFDSVLFEDIEAFEELKQFKKFTNVDWQTKSFDCLMDTYTIDKNGLLFKNAHVWGEYDERIDTKPTQIFYHGIAKVYCYEHSETWKNGSVKVSNSIELEIKFTEGKISNIKVIECELDKYHEERKPSPFINHIKNVVNIEHIEAPKSFGVYGFNIRQKENYWIVERTGDFYLYSDINGDFKPSEKYYSRFTSLTSAYEALRNFCDAVQHNAFDDNEILTRT